MGENGGVKFQGTSVLETLHNPLAVLGQGILLIGLVFGHMHMKAGIVFLGEGDGLV